jgi:hypothetical protein
VSKLQGDPGYRAGWCIHYRPPTGFGPGGKGHDDCEAGVRYDTFAQPRIRTQPCFLTDKGESKPDALPCEKLRRPTPEEIAAHEKWSEDRMGAFGKVMTTILPWRKANKGKNARTTMDCPACGAAQSLHLSISAFNGHVHGRCDTAGCVTWME